jgi:glucokinase
MMEKVRTYLGFDIGGTKCSVVLGRQTDHEQTDQNLPTLEVLDRYTFSTRDFQTPGDVIAHMIKKTRQWSLKMKTGEQPKAAGIACGSPLDSRRGLILSPPNLPGWDEVPVVQMVREALNIPAWLLNDADAGALAEWRYGAGRGCKNMVFITFGTGFGAGLIINGKLYSGLDDGAGEIGHLRISPTGPVGYGKAGSLEGFCSGGGLAQLARMMIMEQTQMGRTVPFCDAAGGLEQVTAKVVGEAADAGDKLAREILAVSGAYLGRGLSILLDLLNPECIVIGSIFLRCHQWLWPSADAELKKESLERTYRRCRVVKAMLGEQIGDFAALSIAIEGRKGALEL